MKQVYVADLEPLTSQLRIFRAGDSYGNQYLWTCTVRWVNPNEAELMAVTDFPDLSMRHAIADAMNAAGCKVVFFTRIRNGQKKYVRVEVAALIDRKKKDSQET